MRCFPGVRPLRSSSGAPDVQPQKMEDLKIVQFSSMHKELSDRTPRRVIMKGWFQEYLPFSQVKDEVKQALALNPSCCRGVAPGPGDVVIHYRNYRGELSERQYANLHFRDLSPEYYDKVLKGIRLGDGGSPCKVWVVGQYADQDPVIAKLREKQDIITLNDKDRDMFQDFCFLTQADHLVMATSTYSWWAAFLGNASQVHFPKQRAPGVTDKKIVVRDDPRYVYHSMTGEVVKP
ncbi:unnamed protein product [Discosporangium mesarthrocarpum]